MSMFATPDKLPSSDIGSDGSGASSWSNPNMPFLRSLPSSWTRVIGLLPSLSPEIDRSLSRYLITAFTDRAGMAAWVSLSFAVSHHSITRRVMCVCPLEEVFRLLPLPAPLRASSVHTVHYKTYQQQRLLVPETMTRWGHPNHPAVYEELRAQLSCVDLGGRWASFDGHLTLVIFRQNQKHLVI
jgi:hypothetical protein